MTEFAGILVAEDDGADRQLRKRAFKRLGFDAQAHFVEDGQEAIDYLETRALGQDATPDSVPRLLLLDLKMPRMNGFDVLRWIGSEHRLRRMSIVILSDSVNADDIAAATELGACDYFVKPQDPDEWVRLLRRLECYWCCRSVLDY